MRLALEPAASSVARLPARHRACSERSRSRSAVDRLAPKRQPLDRALQPVEVRRARLPPAGGVGELVLGPRAVAEQALEARLGAAPEPVRRRRVAPSASARRASASVEVELSDARAQRRDLDAELLGALGRSRLQRERPQALPHLVLDVPGALDLHGDPRELQLGAVPAALELAEAGSLLDERPPVLRLRGEDLLDLALADDRVHRGPEPDVGEELDEVGPAGPARG